MSDQAPRFTHHLLLSLAVSLLLCAILAACSLDSITGGGAAPTPTEPPPPTIDPGPTKTPDAVGPEDIVYIRKHIYGLSGDINLIHPDGSSMRQISFLTADQLSAASDFPVWSPDRQSVAFSSEYRDLYNKAVWNLYLADPQGKGVQQVTGLPQPNNGYFPAVSGIGTAPGVSAWAVMTPPPGGTVSGRVLADGQPVEGAIVVSWLGRGFTQTDAAGRYTMTDVPQGQGWIKAISEQGAGWVDVSADLGRETTAPDMNLDPTLLNASYVEPGWDLDGQGLWIVYSRHWFDTAANQPHYDQRLHHVSVDGSRTREVYAAQDLTLGRPRVRPGHPDQLAVVDGTDLLLLTLNPVLDAVQERRVLRARVQRSAPISWSPDGEAIYYTVESGDLDVALMELRLDGGEPRSLTTFDPFMRDQPGFDISPDGSRFVFEQHANMYIFNPADNSRTPITFYGASSRPSWSGR